MGNGAWCCGLALSWGLTFLDKAISNGEVELPPKKHVSKPLKRLVWGVLSAIYLNFTLSTEFHFFIL